MSGRLPTGIAISALLRRVNDAGGMAMVRARGDADSGGVLILLDEPGGARAMERGLAMDGAARLIPAGPADASVESIEDYWRRRRSRDPDLWVIELSIADAERFAAETILQ